MVGRQRIAHARVSLDRLAHRARHRLEHALDHMMGVLPGKLADMKRHARVCGEGDEELLGERRVEGPHHDSRDVGFPEELATARDIDRRQDEGLVHGQGD